MRSCILDFSACFRVILEGYVCLKYFSTLATSSLSHSKWIAFFCFLNSDHLLPSAHYLEFIPNNILLHILCKLHRSFMSAIYHVLRPSNPKQRGSTHYEFKSVSCLSPFFIQCPLSVVYQSYHVTSWAKESRILTYFLPSLDFPSLMEYTYLPTSVLGYFPPLIYFRTYRLGCLLFHGAILTLLKSPSMPWCITFICLLTT